MVRVWKPKSLLFCLRYDPLIVFRRQNHITFIFIKTMSHDLLVQMAYLCNILKLVHFDSWSWQSFMSTCDVFFHWMYKMKYSWYQESSSWLVCFLGFWWRNVSISDVMVFVFHLAWCVKRVEKSQEILALLDSFQELHLQW